MRVDHVIITSRDLAATADRLLADHDLGSVEGGRHPAWGTANRLVPAGSSYLELMGVHDEGLARANPLGRFVLGSTVDGDHLAAVCLRLEDDAELEALTARLGLDAVPGSRQRPDGSTLAWSLVGMEQAFTEGLPFFVRWAGDTGAATVGTPTRGRGASGFGSVRTGGNPARVRDWVGADVPGLEHGEGAPGVLSAVLDTAGGPVELGPSRR